MSLASSVGHLPHDAGGGQTLSPQTRNMNQRPKLVRLKEPANGDFWVVLEKRASYELGTDSDADAMIASGAVQVREDRIAREAGSSMELQER